jgi:hypothetical protein
LEKSRNWLLNQCLPRYLVGKPSDIRARGSPDKTLPEAPSPNQTTIIERVFRTLVADDDGFPLRPVAALSRTNCHLELVRQRAGLFVATSHTYLRGVQMEYLK